jgi:hypothetical protein
MGPMFETRASAVEMDEGHRRDLLNQTAISGTTSISVPVARLEDVIRGRHEPSPPAS